MGNGFWQNAGYVVLGAAIPLVFDIGRTYIRTFLSRRKARIKLRQHIEKYESSRGTPPKEMYINPDYFTATREMLWIHFNSAAQKHFEQVALPQTHAAQTVIDCLRMIEQNIDNYHQDY
ncbi:MAG: hypothetical protein CMM61_15670 [Rhodospirillaceae bacterium]|nr:hypothetical protein [Rhodospirillaceae bacterium]